MKRKGIVKGHTIELDEPLDLPDGVAVEVDVRAVEAVNLEKYGFKPLPASGHVVTNEMVNQWREELGI